MFMNSVFSLHVWLLICTFDLLEEGVGTINVTYLMHLYFKSSFLIQSNKVRSFIKGLQNIVMQWLALLLCFMRSWVQISASRVAAQTIEVLIPSRQMPESYLNYVMSTSSSVLHRPHSTVVL